MKSIQLVLGLIMSVQVASFGQAGYDPLVSESKLWSNLSGGYGAAMIECCIQTSFVKFEAMASAAGVGEKKVLVSTDSLKTWKFAGLIREYDKEVYFRDVNNVEGKIYDFGAREGETLRLGSFCNDVYSDTVDVKVVRIDTVEYQGVRRKRLEVSYSGWRNDYWIEGIGSEFGLLNSCHRAVGGFKELLCVQDRGSLMYKSAKRGVCYLSRTASLVGKLIPTEIKVYFGSANRRMKVECPTGSCGLSYSIHNLEGQEIGNGALSGDWMDVNLKEGAYFLKITDKNQMVSSRGFVVAK